MDLIGLLPLELQVSIMRRSKVSDVLNYCRVDQQRWRARFNFIDERFWVAHQFPTYERHHIMNYKRWPSRLALLQERSTPLAVDHRNLAFRAKFVLSEQVAVALGLNNLGTNVITLDLLKSIFHEGCRKYVQHVKLRRYHREIINLYLPLPVCKLTMDRFNELIARFMIVARISSSQAIGDCKRIENLFKSLNRIYDTRQEHILNRRVMLQANGLRLTGRPVLKL